jgi:peptide/nickel transport system permease protein
MRALPNRWRRALASPTGVVVVCIWLALLFLAVAAPSLWGHRANADNVDAILAGASRAHPFGTDNLGRDLLARTLVATRISLILATLATALGACLGIGVGTAGAFVGRRLGRVISSAINLALAFPGLLIAIFFAVIFGAGARAAVIALGLAYAPYFARLAQTLTASVVGKEYFAAARILGVRRHRILLRHVLPNIAEPLLITVTVAAGGTLLAFAGLSFLGLGVQIPQYDWGLLVNEGIDRIYTSPMSVVGPGLAIVVAGIGFQLLGELMSRVVSGRSGTARRARAPEAFGSSPAAASGDGNDLVVRAENLTIFFPTTGAIAVRGVSLAVGKSEMIGLVGESGSGKTLTAMALAGLLPAGAELAADRLEFLGVDLVGAQSAADKKTLGMRLGLVFQNPASALNPSMRIGRQVTEGVRHHQHLSADDALSRALTVMQAVALPAPAKRLRQYPHELSGGMKQRAVIAMSLMGTPAFIVADEPTTALDVTVQRQILDLLREVNEASGAACLLVSHDIAVIASVCERIIVMYGGIVVEDAPVQTAITSAAHPYTRALVAAVPTMAASTDVPLATIAGRPPDPANLPAGCPFSPRCPRADDRCRQELPVLQVVHGSEHSVACWHPHVGDPTTLQAVL